MKLFWIRATTGEWLPLENVNLSEVRTIGVYIIWHAGNPSRVVYVGQGDIRERLSAHRSDWRIIHHATHGTLYVTWAGVGNQADRDAIERYLADTWNPLVGEAHPNVLPLAVNSPWAA